MVVLESISRISLVLVANGKPGAESNQPDRLTDRIGLGVLTRLVHRDLVDEVLAQTHRTERRRRLLHARRSEEHTSELQSLMRSSYAVFCLKQKIYTIRQ